VVQTPIETKEVNQDSAQVHSRKLSDWLIDLEEGDNHQEESV